MANSKLQIDLERLRDAINQVAKDDIETRERLDRIINDLEAKLETGDEEENEGLIQDIREAIENFEAEHPRATAILNDIMVTLSNMGI